MKYTTTLIKIFSEKENKVIGIVLPDQTTYVLEHFFNFTHKQKNNLLLISEQNCFPEPEKKRGNKSKEFEMISTSGNCQILSKNTIQINEHIFLIEMITEGIKKIYNQNQENSLVLNQLKGKHIDIFNAINFAPKVLKLFEFHELCQMNKKGVTPLNYAISKQNTESVSILLSKGVDVNLRDQNGIPPFIELTEKKMTERKQRDIFDLMLKTNQLKINDTYKGKTLLSKICASEYLNEYFSLLQDKGWRMCVPLNWDTKKLILLGHQQEWSPLSLIPFDIIKAILRFSSNYIRFDYDESIRMDTIEKLFSEIRKTTENVSDQEIRKKATNLEKKIYDESRSLKEYHESVQKYLININFFYSQFKNVEQYLKQKEEIKSKYGAALLCLSNLLDRFEKDDQKSYHEKNTALGLKNKIIDMQTFFSNDSIDHYLDFTYLNLIKERMTLWSEMFSRRAKENKKRENPYVSESDDSQKKPKC